MSVRKVKGGYRADWRDASGERHRKTFRTKHAAEKWERDARDQARLGVTMLPRATTLGGFLDEWERTSESTLRTNTLDGYLRAVHARIEPRFGDTRLRDIDQRAAQRWVDEMTAERKPDGEPLAGRTIEFNFSVLAIIMKMAAEYGLCKPLPRKTRGGGGGVRLPPKQRYRGRVATPAEVARLGDAIVAPYRALVLIAGFCGLRQSEVFGLHPDAVDFDRHKLHVARTVEHKGGRLVDTTKNGKDRWVTMPTIVEAALEEHLREYPSDGFVFHRDGAALRASAFHHSVWHPARVDAGLEDVWFHSLRHSAASIMIGAGWNAKRVQLELGHHSAAFTLDQYGHLFVHDDDPAREGLNAALDAQLAAVRGAPGQTRTGTPRGAAAFEAAASTDSATGAAGEATP